MLITSSNIDFPDISLTDFNAQTPVDLLTAHLSVCLTGSNLLNPQHKAQIYTRVLVRSKPGNVTAVSHRWIQEAEIQGGCCSQLQRKSQQI